MKYDFKERICCVPSCNNEGHKMYTPYATEDDTKVYCDEHRDVLKEWLNDLDEKVKSYEETCLIRDGRYSENMDYLYGDETDVFDETDSDDG